MTSNHELVALLVALPDAIEDGFEAVHRTLHRLEKLLSDQQPQLDALVQALSAGLDGIEAEIANLKNQPPAAQLDFTALDAVVARLQGDVPPPPA